MQIKNQALHASPPILGVHPSSGVTASPPFSDKIALNQLSAKGAAMDLKTQSPGTRGLIAWLFIIVTLGGAWILIERDHMFYGFLWFFLSLELYSRVYKLKT